MLDVLFAIEDWALVCALIVFSAWWVARERAFFRHGGVGWKHLE